LFECTDLLAEPGILRTQAWRRGSRAWGITVLGGGPLLHCTTTTPSIYAGTSVTVPGRPCGRARCHARRAAHGPGAGRAHCSLSFAGQRALARSTPGSRLSPGTLAGALDISGASLRWEPAPVTGRPRVSRPGCRVWIARGVISVRGSVTRRARAPPGPAPARRTSRSRLDGHSSVKVEGARSRSSRLSNSHPGPGPLALYHSLHPLFGSKSKPMAPSLLLLRPSFFSALLAASLTNTPAPPCFTLCTDPPPRAGLRARLGLLGPAPRAGPSPRARRTAAGGHAPGSRPAPPTLRAPGLCARAGFFKLLSPPTRRAVPRPGTCPRLAAHASPLRVPGLLARAGSFKLVAPASMLRTGTRFFASRQPGPIWSRLASSRDLRAVRRARGPPGPASPPAGSGYVT
jgi:hypothetical protein